MKECELCEKPARMYCESDQASLCRSCDSKVHSANFLVARHLRSLLCQVCQSPTPWKASGEKLPPTVSICQRCIGNCKGGGGVVDQDEESDDDDDELELLDDEESEDEIEEEDEENQVVPWTSSTPPPPPSSSSSSDDEYSSCGGGDEDDQEIDRDLSLKRLHKNIVETAREASSSSSSSSRPSKQQKREVHITRSDSEESVAIHASLNELQKRLVGKKG